MEIIKTSGSEIPKKKIAETAHGGGILLDDLAISLSAINGLKAIGVTTLEEAAEYSEAELSRKIPYKRTIDEIKELLAENNLSLNSAK